jgi:hypothetical protein
VVPLILVAVATGIGLAWRDFNSAPSPTDQGSCGSNDQLDAVADIYAVDTDSLTATMRLDFSPYGNLASQREDQSFETLKRSITMTTLGLLAQPPGSQVSAAVPPSYTSATSTYVYLAGDYMQDVDVVLPLIPGTANSSGLPSTPSARYPFDTYTNTSSFSLQFWQGTGPTRAKIHACVILTGSVGGWTISPSSGGGVFNITIARAPPVLFYAYFVMALMWALALGGVAMAVIMMMRKQDEIDTAAFAYLAALLFAFPLIRSTLPGNPGPGSLIDILAYYWTEVIVATTLVVLLVRWITLKGKRDREDDKARKEEAAEAAEVPVLPEV